MRYSIACIALCAVFVVTGTASAQDQTRSMSTKDVLDRVDKATVTTFKAELSRRGDIAEIHARDGSIPIANAYAAPQNVQELPVSATLIRAPNGQVVLKDINLQATDAWRALSKSTRDRWAELNTAYDRLRATESKALAPNATPADREQLRIDAGVSKEEIVAAYAAVPKEDAAGRDVLLKQYVFARNLGKSIYARDDRYPPEAYTEIYRNSRGAFALQLAGSNKPHCSGVLIGKDLGLTNNHCLANDLPTDLKVVFDYENGLDGHRLSAREFRVEAFVVSSSAERAGLDFALIRIGKDANGHSAGDTYKPQCLSTVRVRRDDPLYVIGFPLGDPRMVADNAFVYFPFQVTAHEYVELELLVKSELQSRAAQNQADAKAKLVDFSTSYRKRTLGGFDVYEYYSQRFNSQPTIGADCDTFHGNSGSPVYQRRTHHVVGLLFDGQKDESDPWKPGWSSHEAILPITRVIEQIDATRPDWAAGQDVCIRG